MPLFLYKAVKTEDIAGALDVNIGYGKSGYNLECMMW